MLVRGVDPSSQFGCFKGKSLLFFTIKQCFFGPFSLRYVLQYAMCSLEITLIILLFFAGTRDPNYRTIPFNHHELSTQDFTDGFEMGELLIEMICSIWMQKVTKRFANDLLTRISQSIKPCLVDLQNAAVLIQGLIP